MAEVTQQQVVDYIKGISVLELSQLVKTLVAELGVSAAAAMPMRCASWNRRRMPRAWPRQKSFPSGAKKRQSNCRKK